MLELSRSHGRLAAVDGGFVVAERLEGSVAEAIVSYSEVIVGNRVSALLRWRKVSVGWRCAF
jgi:hypothetical protein